MFLGLKRRIGALLFDVPLYTYLFLLKKGYGDYAWMLVRNRNEEITVNENSFGIKCHWQWTSELYLPKLFPFFGKTLFKKSLTLFEFNLGIRPPIQNDPKLPKISFIIGHRGEERLPLLLKTIESIASQKNCHVECIVVEQDSKARIKDALPKWVNYFHTVPEYKDMPFSRARAFNYGAQQASSNSLIFHDNDLLIPNNYAIDTHRKICQGYDFVNLKRFIFYLTESATIKILTQKKVNQTLTIHSIMQNAEGGGSIGSSRQSYFSIGGFDERFIGWGGEDNEFWERVHTKKVWEFGSLPLIHLWHGPQVEKLDINNSPTKSLYNNLSQQAPSKRIAWLKKNQSSTDISPSDEKKACVE